MRTALTIAGSDSGAGAGIQADLRTFAAHDVYGVCAVTAVTAQNTVEVTAVHDVPDDVVRSQIEAVVGDIGVHAAKTGMLANRGIIEVVADCIGALDIPSVVVDPVIVSQIPRWRRRRRTPGAVAAAGSVCHTQPNGGRAHYRPLHNVDRRRS